MALHAASYLNYRTLSRLGAKVMYCCQDIRSSSSIPTDISLYPLTFPPLSTILMNDVHSPVSLANVVYRNATAY